MADTHDEPHADPHISAPADALIPPDDRDIGRDWAMRTLIALLVVLLCLALPTLFGNIVGSIFGYIGSFWLGTAGFLAGAYFLSVISKRLFVYNEEWKAYVTNNPFGGQNVAYGPGLHFSYIWEQRNKDGEYDLTVITVPFEMPAQTKSAKVTVTGSFQYRIDLPHITRYIGANPTTIRNGLIAFIKTFLTQELSKNDAEYNRTHLGSLNQNLKNMFVNQASELEVKYGIETVNLFLETIQLPEDVQKTRDSVDEMDQLNKVVAKMFGLTDEEYAQRKKDGTITFDQNKQMLDRAMAASSNNARINVNTLEGNSTATPMISIPSN